MTTTEIVATLRQNGEVVIDGWALRLEVDHENVVILTVQALRPGNGADLVFLGHIANRLGVPGYAITMLTEALTNNPPGQQVSTRWWQEAPMPGGQ